MNCINPFLYPFIHPSINPQFLSIYLQYPFKHTTFQNTAFCLLPQCNQLLVCVQYSICTCRVSLRHTLEMNIYYSQWKSNSREKQQSCTVETHSGLNKLPWCHLRKTIKNISVKVWRVITGGAVVWKLKSLTACFSNECPHANLTDRQQTQMLEESYHVFLYYHKQTQKWNTTPVSLNRATQGTFCVKTLEKTTSE